MRQKMKQLMGILLSLMMVLGLMPGMSLTAYAATATYTALKNNATVVHFHNSDWYIIADDSTSATEGTVTLLSADESFGMSVFNSNSEANNSYNASAVKAYLDKVVAGNAGEGKPDFRDVADAIKPVDLTTYNYNSTTDVKETTDSAKLYLLDTAAANNLHNTIKSDKFEGEQYGGWWLRSPGDDGCDAAFVGGESGIVFGSGLSVRSVFGVRPALQLNLASVIFSSVNLSGGANATASGGSITQNYFDVGTTRSPMTAVTYTANSGYKFPETSNYYTTTNGIIVERTSDTVVTVSGTPTANTTITIPDAHTHSFTYAASGGIITATCGGSGTCDITEGLTLTISAPTGNLVYDGTTTYPAALSTGYNTTAFPGTYSISYKKDGSAYSGVPKDAGTYTASVTAGTGDGAKTASVSYTIAKAVPAITTAPTAGEITYGQTLANSNLTGGTASVSGDFAWKDPTVAPAVSDSQKTEYDVVFTPTDGNYGTAECKVKLTVNKADSAVTKAPVAKTLTYSGSAQELIIAGTATGGEMQYALGTATEATQPYTTSIPAKTEAGTYYVWYKAVGDANHNDSAASYVTAKILEAPQPETEASSPAAVEKPITIPKAPAKVKTKAKKNTVTVSWTKIRKTKKTKALRKQITNVEVQYSTDSSFPKETTDSRIIGKNKTKLVLRGLQRKTMYYIRVRYVGADGVSNWKTKRVRTK